MGLSGAPLRGRQHRLSCGALFASRTNSDHPSQVQAGVYAAVLRDLRAVAAAGSRNGPEMVARMKSMPNDEPLFRKGSIRTDGRHVHAMHVTEVKSPEKSKKPWDYLKTIRTIPAEKAFRPASSEECALVK